MKTFYQRIDLTPTLILSCGQSQHCSGEKLFHWQHMAANKISKPGQTKDLDNWIYKHNPNTFDHILTISIYPINKKQSLRLEYLSNTIKQTLKKWNYLYLICIYSEYKQKNDLKWAYMIPLCMLEERCASCWCWQWGHMTLVEFRPSSPNSVMHQDRWLALHSAAYNAVYTPLYYNRKEHEITMKSHWKTNIKQVPFR